MTTVADFGATGMVSQTTPMRFSTPSMNRVENFCLVEESSGLLGQSFSTSLAVASHLCGKERNRRYSLGGARSRDHSEGSHGGSADPNSFQPNVWSHERMPVVADLEITGIHPDSDGIQITGVMEPTITGVLLRKLRHGFHVTGRARNVLIDHCHIYHNLGVGVFFDRVNLHQTIISNSHISYCRLGGIRVEASEIRNMQITGNDIEYNNNRAHGVPGADAEPTAEIYFDAREGSLREGTICGNTIQATYSPGGANIRMIGQGAEQHPKAGCGRLPET